MSHRFILFAVLLNGLATAKIGGSSSVSKNTLDDDQSLTDGQKIILEKFKARVSPKLPHAYMKEDMYLVRWLKARQFDELEAEKLLEDDLKWRKKSGIEKLNIEEDFPDLLEEYPVEVDVYARNGAPVITAYAGEWDLRKAHVTGKATRLLLFLDKLMDDAAKKVRHAQQQGKDVNGFHVVINLEGFNKVQHGCSRCVLGIVRFLHSYENHFPGLMDKIFIFNAPPSIEAIAPLIRKEISSDISRHIKVFGSNKAEWSKYLQEFIAMDQLTKDFGGNRERE